MAQYSQKDICSLLGITRETLRHYEKEGLIVPHVNPANQYRYYDDRHVYLIAETKRYQANGFSLEEIHDMIYRDSLADYTERMEEKQRFFERMSEEYYWKQEYNRDYVMKLRMIPELLNNIFEGVHEEVVFVPLITGESLHLSEEETAASRFMMEQLQFTFMMMYFPDYHNDLCQRGFGSQKWLLTQFADLNVKTEIIPGSRAVMTVIDTEGEELTGTLARPLEQWAEEHAMKPKGTFILRQLLRTNEDGLQHRYFEAILPVED